MYHGCINVYKEKGFTSFDVIAKLRGILKQKKIGHTGTLDPNAEGVLPVCLGQGTKLCDMLTDKDKVYRAELILGTVTDTQDNTGTVLSRCEEIPTEEAVYKAIMSFVGPYKQVPPMYSAIKIGGKKLYELAREGKTIEREARSVEIYSIEVLEVKLPVISMRVHCSKGTYIRTLCHDIGELLGCGACMGELLREQVGRFLLDGALTLSEIEACVKNEMIDSFIVPIDEMFMHYPEYLASTQEDRLVLNGNVLQIPQTEDHLRVYDSKGRFVGIYLWNKEQKGYKPEKMFLMTE